MADFSDKYRRALDGLDISPDFKERTAAKMIALRDIPDKAGSSSIILMNDNVNRKKKMRRMMYTVGAIAACAAVCMGVVFTGMLDRDPNVIRYDDSETAAPEQTDVLPNEEPIEEISETANRSETASDNEAVVHDVSYAETSEVVVTEVPENEEELSTETQGSIVSEAKAADNTAAPIVTAAPVTEAPVIGVLQNAGTETPATTAATAKTVPTVTTTSPEGRVITEALPTGAAEYVAPVGADTPHEVIDDEEVIHIQDSYTPAMSPEGAVGDNDHEYDEALEEAPVTAAPVTSDNGSAPTFNDPAFSYNGAVGYDFSAYDEAKKFDKKNAYATITPLFEEYDEGKGMIASYNAAEVRGTVKMRELISAAALYAEDGTWEAVAAPPENSRYIIDFADEEGNSLRGYAGDGFICYAVTDMKGNEPVDEVVYCYFKLTEKESKRLEGILYSYVD